MNWDVVRGKWNQVKGKAREEWGDITDDEWQQLKGDRDQLVGKVQERYGWARNDAEHRVDNWAERHFRE
jgi:uncharacterized protein YjbJ (UPF0337 family)